MGMSLKTNMLRRAWARGSSRRRMKARKPLNTNAAGVSPGCTRLLRKNTYGPIGISGSADVTSAVNYFAKRVCLSLFVTSQGTTDEIELSF